MQSPEQILAQVTEETSNQVIIKAMKLYANEKLDEAAEKAFAGYKENGLTNTANNAREIILKLKDRI